MKQPLTPISKVIEVLRRGGVGILPTDTLYGMVGAALSKDAVERIYTVRRRNPKKPMIILIGEVNDTAKFGVRLSPDMKILLHRIWPGKVSVILPISPRGTFLSKFSYLHRGTKTLAFRLPASKSVRALVRKTGPLIAPSANTEGNPPAKTIRAARKYFGDGVDFYRDGGRRDSPPSTIIKIKQGKIFVVRKGAAKLDVLKSH